MEGGIALRRLLSDATRGFVRLTMRLGDDLGAQLSAAAAAAGVPRSQLIVRLLRRELGAEGTAPKPLAARPGGRRKQVKIAFDDSELTAIDAAADALGMTRNQWIAARARGGIAAGKGNPVVSLQTRRGIREVFDQVRRLGLNINQAVRAVNASAMPESGMNMAMAADNLSRMRDDVRAQIRATETTLLAAVQAEAEYWRKG
jgi:hypothetical protein